MITTKAVHLTFVGHQTWHISDGQNVVLLDPILCRAFGPTGVPFEVWPPRDVDATAMPDPAALILSHEHLDHFHLPSLDLLDRRIPLYTGMTVPAAVVEAIETLGFTVHRRDFTEPLIVGDLEITLYPAGAKTMFWESRVVQPLVRLVGEDCGGVFIGVDADLSDTYLTRIGDGAVPVPDLAIVSNNSQSVPYGAPSTDTNLLPGLDGPHHRSTGLHVLHVLHSLLSVYLAPLTGVPHVALCGNGFTAPLAPHGPFLYGDHRALTLVTGYLPSEADLSAPSVFDELLELVARAHSAPATWPPEVTDLMEPYTLAAALAGPVPEWIAGAQAWMSVLELTADAHGLPDVITLAYIAAEVSTPLAPRWIRRTYLRHARDHGAQWTETTLTRALTLWAEATGLHSLHGLNN